MKLLIPGPVTTHPAVRAAAGQDYAPWDPDFRPILARIRARLLAMAGGVDGTHMAIPLQGCGHFAIEAAIRSFVPPGGKMLVPITGQYAERLSRLAETAGRAVARLPIEPQQALDPALVTAALRAEPSITHLAVIYSETATGVVHDAPALARAAGAEGRRVIVDAVSAFGALPFDIAALPMVDAVVFTANKCLEGLPGAGFVVSPVARLEDAANRAGSWSLDLADLYQTTLRSGPGSSRFTPAAPILAALDVALDLHDAEGGCPARLARYAANRQALCDSLRAIGLQPCLDLPHQGPVVVNVHAPADPAWALDRFVAGLKKHGFLISNFQNTPFPSFRIGCIGQVFPEDMRGCARAIDSVLADMDVKQRRPGTPWRPG